MIKQSPNKITLKGQGTERTISSQVFQSPLAGISDHIFRRLVRRWAPDALLFTEMVNATFIDQDHQSSKVKDLGEEEGPIAVQLFGYLPEELAEAAKRAEGAGAFLIDINMGCPVKKIASKGGGSGLLKDPALAAKIISQVSNAVKVPVTVKTRLGWNNNSVNPIHFAKLLEESGAQLLTLHGRTREQGFSGKANWQAISLVKKTLSIPVIANGDIKSPEDAIECLKVTGADGVMIGRGSMGAPWLIGQIDAVLRGYPTINTPSARERILLIKEQLLGLLKEKGNHGLFIARKHINWTCRDFPGATKLRHDLMRVNKANEALSLIENHLQANKSL